MHIDKLIELCELNSRFPRLRSINTNIDGSGVHLEFSDPEAFVPIDRPEKSAGSSLTARPQTKLDFIAASRRARVVTDGPEESERDEV